MNSEHDDFMGGGGKSVPFDNPGDTVTGTIMAPPEKRQQTDMDEGKPKTFQDGSPMYMFAVRLQTNLRDPENPFDTGERTIYLKWKSLDAVRNAVRATGAPGLQVGGQLTLRMTGFGPRKKVGHNPPKLWAAQYVPPDPNQAFMNTPTSTPSPNQDSWAQQQQAAPAWPAQQQQAAPAWPAQQQQSGWPAQPPSTGQPMSQAGIADMQRLQAQQQANVARLQATPQVNLDHRGQPQPDQPGF